MGATWMRHGSDMEATWGRHGDMDATWTQHGGDMEATWRRHGGDMETTGRRHGDEKTRDRSDWKLMASRPAHLQAFTTHTRTVSGPPQTSQDPTGWDTTDNDWPDDDSGPHRPRTRAEARRVAQQTAAPPTTTTGTPPTHDTRGGGVGRRGRTNGLRPVRPSTAHQPTETTGASTEATNSATTKREARRRRASDTNARRRRASEPGEYARR